MKYSAETASFKRNCSELLELINVLRASSAEEEVLKPVKKKRRAGDSGNG